MRISPALYFICLTSIVTLANSCGSKKYPVQDQHIEISAKKTETDSIVFLLMSIEYDTSEGESRIRLENTIKSAGALKRKPVFESGGANLQCIFRSSKDENTDTIYVPHPLFKIIEYADTNGVLNKKMVETSTADFFVRIDKKSYDQVFIFENTQFTKKKQIALIRF